MGTRPAAETKSDVCVANDDFLLEQHSILKFLSPMHTEALQGNSLKDQQSADQRVLHCEPFLLGSCRHSPVLCLQLPLKKAFFGGLRDCYYFNDRTMCTNRRNCHGAQKSSFLITAKVLCQLPALLEMLDFLL